MSITGDIAVLQDRIIRNRYAYEEEETWGGLSTRVATHVAKAEKRPEAEDVWRGRFYESLVAMDFIAGGRTLRNAGRPLAQLLNCFALGVRDNIEDIGEMAKRVLIVASGGGGIGINFSNLRPIGSPLSRKGGHASGPCSYMKMIDDIGRTVETGGQRRIALMFILDVDHPEIMEFIDLKRKEGYINYANISVGITQPFIDAVRHDEDWDLVFGGRIQKTVRAREIWNKIVHANWAFGDPGILNITNLDKFNNIAYHSNIHTVNPCGEIPLEEDGSCCLGSINLNNMLKPGVTVDGDQIGWSSVDWGKLKRTVQTAIRFLDNVLTVNQYPLEEIKEVSEENRRIGLGVMGLHYMLLSMGIEYGANEKCLKFLDELFRFIKETAYSYSVELAIEKKPFPSYKRTYYMQSPFVQSLPDWLQEKIMQSGIRNCALLTVPPTGTTAQIPQVSTGLEPVFAPAYTRKARLGTNGNGERTEKEFFIIDPKYLELEAAGLPRGHFVSSHDLYPRDHLMVQVTIQKHVDNSLSKTINIPEDFPEEELGETMLHFADRVKGFTVYRTNSRDEEILTPCTIDEARRGERDPEVEVCSLNGDNCDTCDEG